jgi:hypothetical protein
MTEAGRYYVFREGRAIEVEVSAPDYVICRRLEDFAPAPVPATAVISACPLCGLLVASSPMTPYPGVP